MKRHSKKRYKEFCKQLKYIGNLGRIEELDPNPINKLYLIEKIDTALRSLGEGYFVGN